MNNKKKILTILFGLGIYLLSTGLSYAAFNYVSKAGTIFTSPLPDSDGKDQKENSSRKTLFEISGPKSATCPINGAGYTKAEKNIWETRRPLAIMVENHLESRPQSGLSDSDVIYEAVAEGGITRFMAIFYCKASAYDSILGPIRSARTYFLDWASEYNFPLYTHVGGANTPGPANALGQINTYGWGSSNDLNQFSIGYPTFWRDYERLGRTVATEHTMYSTTEKLWAIGEKRGYTNLDPDEEEWSDNFTSWSFVKQEPTEKGMINTITYNFWEDENYLVSWKYDPSTNLYKRNNGSQTHLDININEQLSTKNLVLQFVSERHANDGYPGNVHLLLGTIGKGKAFIIKDGQLIEGTWAKSTRLKRTIFYDEKGKEINFNPGRIWISALPIGTKVDY
ncbi:MAG: DUF3048 domain-containing protein [Patescibacteria group bacterium]|nr:DUF3048 domain-containing protein [Patescibacteria group bacterium]